MGVAVAVICDPGEMRKSVFTPRIVFMWTVFPDWVNCATPTRHTKCNTQTQFGTAVLSDLKDRAQSKVLGRFRFSETAVNKLAVSRVSNSAFVLEYHGDDSGGLGGTKVHQSPLQARQGLP